MAEPAYWNGSIYAYMTYGGGHLELAGANKTHYLRFTAKGLSWVFQRAQVWLRGTPDASFKLLNFSFHRKLPPDWKYYDLLATHVCMLSM